MAFHGTADPLVPYVGGDMQSPLLAWLAGWVEGPAYFVGAEEWAATWAENNGCNPEPEVIPPQGDVRGIRYVECDADAGMIFYTIEEGGHTWPGGMPIPGMGKTSKDIKATEEMWQFFQNHHLDEQP
jgi:polyhydroxybutyrate depolymerase